VPPEVGVEGWCHQGRGSKTVIADGITVATLRTPPFVMRRVGHPRGSSHDRHTLGICRLRVWRAEGGGAALRPLWDWSDHLPTFSSAVLCKGAREK